ncbi:MAG: ComF family protein [Planctomycetaceae bacterium]|nr:ComF family protein [Planctomycetaceae bacterium]
MLSAKWSFTSVPIVALSNALIRKQRTALEATNPDLIIPIPQHWRKRLFRHFNPAWLIATTIANKIGGKCDAHLLRRCRTTKPQKRMSISARRNNQKDTFALVDEWMIRGKRILLVDDVLTTGATCSEAARILRNAGAEECHVAVIGRVLDHSA